MRACPPTCIKEPISHRSCERSLAKRETTDLTETEGSEQASFDAIGLDRLGRVKQVLELAQLLRDVVGVPVARDKT